MNIAFYWGTIPCNELGGIDRVTNVLAQGFKNRGDKVYLIYSGGEEREFSHFDAKYKYENPQRVGIISVSLLRNFLLKNKIDVIVNQRAYDSKVILYLNQAAGTIPIVSCLHNIPGHEFFSTSLFKRLLKRFFLQTKLKLHYQELLQYSSKVALLSDSFIPQYTKLFLPYHCSTEKLVAISNPLSFSTSESVELNKKEKIVIYVGRLEEQQKRVSSLFKIWSFIEKIKDLEDWKLLLIGTGPAEQDYKDFVKKKGLNRVFFQGRCNPEEHYRKSSILLLTSDYEGFPLVLMEAMQFGVVPMAFDTFSSLKDIIDNNKNGVIIPKGQIKKYITELIKLMRNNDLRFLLAKNALVKSQKFSLQNIIDQWQALLASLIKC